MNLSTYKKSILLILISSTFFLVLFTVLYLYTLQQEKSDYKSTTEDFKKEIESLLHSSWESNKNQVDDMSFWDDFVTYTHTKDKKWFDFYVGTTIDVYNLDYVSVYDLQGNLIEGKTKNDSYKDIIPKKLLPVLYQKRYLNFFLKDHGIVYNVFASTIHPSFDKSKLKSNPAGYFFMALKLDNSYFRKIQQISSAQLCSIQENENAFDFKKIKFSKKLLDWEGKSVGYFHFTKKYSRDFTTSKIILRIIIVSFILNLLIFVFFSKKWFYTPLKLITGILESGSAESSKIKDLQNIKGEFGYIGNLFEDLNNQKIKLIKAKQDAEKSDKLKSAFLANLSHEIRTPINAINGFSELLLHTKTTKEDQVEYLNVIHKSGENLINIIDDLIEMSKIESNLITPNYVSISLERMMKELFESIKVTIDPYKKIKFNLIHNASHSLYQIVTDETKLKQIITNLVTNAIKFTEKGSVTLGYEINEVKQQIEFYVKDTGIGINEENLDKIFERFRRIESDLSIKAGGLGLGLSISKAYIELLHGNITLESKIGEGSTFHFCIPLKYDMNPVEKFKKVREKKQLDTKKQTILIAEDDNINFLLFQKIMKNYNYTILRAKNGQEAVDICRKNPEISLILMDIKMPILSGFEAILQIKPILPSIPIIAQTAYSSEEDKVKIKNAGFTDYISKPLERIKLNQLIQTYLHHS